MYSEFEIGELVPGTSYRVVARIGQGGMGSVYEVEHRELGKRFVLKALLHEFVGRGDLVRRMRGEWRALGSLEHPHIVSVSDAGVSSNGVPYYVMERLIGETLAARLKQKGRLDVVEALRIAAEVLDGLSAAHAINVVHRDIKPPNIFLTRSGVKVLDFGIAKSLAGNAAITGRGVAIGTPRYMSPEQASGQPIDARADLYALGLVLFEMLTGQSPFEGANSQEVFLAHVTKRPPTVDSIVDHVPPELSHLVARLLEKKPSDRISSAQRAAEVIRQIARSCSGPRLPLADTHAVPFSGALTPDLQSLPAAERAALDPQTVSENGPTFAFAGGSRPGAAGHVAGSRPSGASIQGGPPSGRSSQPPHTPRTELIHVHQPGVDEPVPSTRTSAPVVVNSPVPAAPVVPWGATPLPEFRSFDSGARRLLTWGGVFATGLVVVGLLGKMRASDNVNAAPVSGALVSGAPVPAAQPAVAGPAEVPDTTAPAASGAAAKSAAPNRASEFGGRDVGAARGAQGRPSGGATPAGPPAAQPAELPQTSVAHPTPGANAKPGSRPSERSHAPEAPAGVSEPVAAEPVAAPPARAAAPDAETPWNKSQAKASTPEREGSSERRLPGPGFPGL